MQGKTLVIPKQSRKSRSDSDMWRRNGEMETSEPDGGKRSDLRLVNGSGDFFQATKFFNFW
jgi:hypothetical protein